MVEGLKFEGSMATFKELRRLVWLQRNEQWAEWFKMRMDRWSRLGHIDLCKPWKGAWILF